MLALLPSFRVYLSASSKDEDNIPGVIAACPSLWDAPAVFFPFGLCGIRSSITTSFHFRSQDTVWVQGVCASGTENVNVTGSHSLSDSTRDRKGWKREKKKKTARYCRGSERARKGRKGGFIITIFFRDHLIESFDRVVFQAEGENASCLLSSPLVSSIRRARKEGEGGSYRYAYAIESTIPPSFLPSFLPSVRR